MSLAARSAAAAPLEGAVQGGAVPGPGVPGPGFGSVLANGDLGLPLQHKKKGFGGHTTRRLVLLHRALTAAAAYVLPIYCLDQGNITDYPEKFNSAESDSVYSRSQPLKSLHVSCKCCCGRAFRIRLAHKRQRFRISTCPSVKQQAAIAQPESVSRSLIGGRYLPVYNCSSQSD